MLKLVWQPNGTGAPDEASYRNAVDTLVATGAGQTATATFPRNNPMAIGGLADLTRVIKAWLPTRAVPTAAVKLMLHGYSYDPRHAGDPAYDPFSTLYGVPGAALNPRRSWLPLVEECDDRGMRAQETAIAFAWTSTGSFAEYAEAGWSESYQYACIDLVHLAAHAVAAVLRVLAGENVRVDVLAHSLGTRLFVQSVANLGASDATLNDIILLDGAEYSVDAAATCAGRRFNVVNVTNVVDAVLVDAGEQFGDPSRVPGSVQSCSLGRYGLGTLASWTAPNVHPPNWVDIALDRRDVQAWFKSNGGYTLTPTASDNLLPDGFLNHWACYTELGNRAWLTDLLWKPNYNGGTLAASALPKGVLASPQPVIAGVGIPTTTPMTKADRMRYQEPKPGGGSG